MLSRTFNFAIRGFHYSRRYWSPEKAEDLIYLHRENNAFDLFAIKTCKEDGIIVGHLPHGLTLKVHLRQRILAVFTSTHYRKSPLVQSGMESPCQVTTEMSLNLKNGQLLDSLIQLVEVVYSEPMPPIIFGSFLADEIQVECVSNNIFKTNSLKTEKNKKGKRDKII